MLSLLPYIGSVLGLHGGPAVLALLQQSCCLISSLFTKQEDYAAKQARQAQHAVQAQSQQHRLSMHHSRHGRLVTLCLKARQLVDKHGKTAYLASTVINLESQAVALLGSGKGNVTCFLPSNNLAGISLSFWLKGPLLHLLSCK